MMKTIFKNKYNSFKNEFSKFIIVLVVVSMTFETLGINHTNAYFTSSVTVTGNTFTAGTLDLSVDKANLGTAQLGSDNNLTVTNSGSLPFKYEIKPEFSNTSDMAFCNQLNISVTEDVNTLYSGVLPNLDFSEIIEKDGHNDLVINITDPSESVIGKTCSFNLISKAWQEELDYAQGFTDTASTSVIVNSEKEGILTDGDVVLNEFLANPNGSEYNFDFGNDSSTMPQGEWIELYNNGDKEVDLNGWYIVNKNWTINIDKFAINVDPITNKVIIDSSHIVGGNTIIPAHKWLVVYMNKEILDNGVDYIRLFNGNDIQKDSIAYGALVDHCYLKPTPDSENNSLPSSSLCLFGVPGNKSYARIPDGTGAWFDPIPTPGTTNDFSEEIIPKVEDVITPEVPDTTTDDATIITGDDTADTTTIESTPDTTTDGTVTTDNTGTTATIDDDTTTTATADQPEQAVDAIASDEDPTVESVVTEPAQAIESIVAPTENTDDATIEKSVPAEPVVEAPAVETSAPVVEAEVSADE